ncbi:hypothetical protein OF83DRAFT_1066934 [Amylostereum chailletii]|nr:hypothetical protein OF83DRAFT_1066934 [Amylostereum chailletii]
MGQRWSYVPVQVAQDVQLLCLGCLVFLPVSQPCLTKDPRPSTPSLFLNGSPLPKPEDILPSELLWVKRRDWLRSCGYVLRAQCQDDWIPSWKSSGKWYLACEDGRFWISSSTIDAIRKSDGAYVYIKYVTKTYEPDEADISDYLGRGALQEDPRNYCVPIYDVLDSPAHRGNKYIVEPLLRPFDNPRFETFGECVEFFTQLFEVRPLIQFMHGRNVAHRDCCYMNIMMDATPIFPEPWHPTDLSIRRDWRGKVKPLTRTQRPVRYYLIDFGLSARFESRDPPPLLWPLRGGDKSVPEHDSREPCDPFATDVYYLRSLIRTYFMKSCFGFGFIDGLVADMMREEPSERPDIDEVISRFQKIRSSLSWWKLRSPVIYRRSLVFDRPRTVRIFDYLRNTAVYVRRRVPSIPVPGDDCPRL